VKNDYYLLKDKCRKGLLKHLEKAFSVIPGYDDPLILDTGCGTGVPTLWMAENLSGKITAVDSDKNAIEWLRKKIRANHLENRITLLNISINDLQTEHCNFNIILAEGLLNVIGFENGFIRITGMLKKGGYFIIHDEYRDHERKCDFINHSHCDLTGTIYLDKMVWWDDYYSQLEEEINAVNNLAIRDLFKSDLKEIELYRMDPDQFESMYYIVRKIK
jgi:cyclopropane fatty-acyl-phospholipid synthase-like methyltransferase